MSGGRLTEYLFGWVIGVTMQKLMIDLETKSDVDITKAGVYRYADSPYFDILLFAYSVDDAPVKVVDLACGETIRNASFPMDCRRMPAATTSARKHGGVRWWRLPIWACR